jgi:exosortase/archaeosortase family protein
MTAALGRDRAQWLAVAAVIAAVNGLGTGIINTIADRGPLMALLALGSVNPVVWFTLFAALAIAFEPESDAPMQRADWVALGAVLVTAMAPVVATGSVGVAIAAGYLWVTSPRASRGRRAAIVLLALTTMLLWGRFFLMAVGDPLLALDSHFVALLAGTSAHGNLVMFADGSKPILIGYACSSMHNMTYAIMLWAAVTQLLRIPVGPKSLAICAAAMIGNILVNGVRLAVIAHHRTAFDYWHSGAGGSLFGWGGVVVIALIIGVGSYALAPRRI